MKKIIIILLTLIGLEASAQQETQMEIIGVPIGQSVKKTVSDFIAKGFTVTPNTGEDSYVVLNGGKIFKMDAEIVLSVGNDIVYQIGAFFYRNNVTEAYNTFTSIEKNLETKYGIAQKIESYEKDGSTIEKVLSDGRGSLVTHFKTKQMSAGRSDVFLMLDGSNIVRLYLRDMPLMQKLVKEGQYPSFNSIPFGASKDLVRKIFARRGAISAKGDDTHLTYFNFTHLGLQDGTALLDFEHNQLIKMVISFDGSKAPDAYLAHLEKQLTKRYGEPSKGEIVYENYSNKDVDVIFDFGIDDYHITYTKKR